MRISLLTLIVSTLLTGSALAAPATPPNPSPATAPVLVDLNSVPGGTLRPDAAVREFFLDRRPTGGISLACNMECVKWRRVRTPYCAEWGRDSQGHGVCTKWEYTESDTCVTWSCGH